MPPRKLIALLLLCNAVSIVIAIVARKYIIPPAEKSAPIVQTLPPAVGPAKPAEPAESKPDLLAALRKPVESVPALPENEPYPTGYAKLGSRIIIGMSDGSTRTSEDNIPAKFALVAGAGVKRLQYVQGNFVVWDGKRYWFKSAPSQQNTGRLDTGQNVSNKLLQSSQDLVKSGASLAIPPAENPQKNANASSE